MQCIFTHTMTTLTFNNANPTIWSFMTEVAGGEMYYLDPGFQRDYTKSREWEQNMLRHIIWTKQTGTMYFHPVERTKDGETYDMQECIDGKSRSLAIRKFINDEFTISSTEFNEYPHLHGIPFSQWPLVDKRWFNTIRLNIATATRTLTDDEITKLFNNLKTSSTVKTGELLNSNRNSPLLKMYEDRAVARPDFKEAIVDLWGQNKKHKLEEMISSMAHMIEFPDDIRDPNGARKEQMWETGISAAKFDKIIEYTVAVYGIIKHIKRKSSATVFLPFFKLYVMKTPVDVIDRIKEKVTIDIFDGKASGGATNCVLKRYNQLLLL